MILMGFFASFLAPYDPTVAGRDTEYENGAPQIPQFWDENGFSFRPFVYGTERKRSIETNFRWVTTINKDERRYIYFFVDGYEWSLIDTRIDLPIARHRLRPQGVQLEQAPVRDRGGAGPPVRHRRRPARTSSRARCTRSGPRSPSARSAC